jgi:hypothetical protein
VGSKGGRKDRINYCPKSQEKSDQQKRSQLFSILLKNCIKKFLKIMKATNIEENMERVT